MSSATLTDAELLAEFEQAFALRRQVDARLVELAGELSARSQASDGLAGRHGCTSAAAFVAQLGRISQSSAGQLCRLGAATQPRLSLLGGEIPAAFPTVGAALGDISLDAASFIVGALSSVSSRAAIDDLEVAEAALVEFATDNSADMVRKLAARWCDALDPDGVLPEELPAQRFLRRTQLATGMKRYVMELDPVNAAYVDAVIDAAVGAAIRKPQFEDRDVTAPATPADETPALPLAQLAADAIVDLARHGIACDNRKVPLPSTTVVVRVSLESLQTGIGLASIDGCDYSIPAAVARVMAADANIIPAVLGANSAILDFGLSRRLFSTTQKLALIDRDGGCGWPGCCRPPSYTEAHHMKWWMADGGPTDLSNGVMLCSRHHHTIHDLGWTVSVENNVPWFVPPSSIDATRTPRRGGRLPQPDLAAA
ncbi:HNH endonuclease [Glaciihabitans arcticus]|uniref:HNH endonuclease n=1 Tax=Glaciihabitans arcticus TaxID=2668039 RepID=A0A4Q9GXJ9_9MICO|nr:HNH endonuclease signature motif containing protein [Glaciihabitans arcticus]TBN58338.1 HNH endonuclease [Glaciihabitans arcticus]